LVPIQILKNAQKFYQSLKKETKELKEQQIEELKLNEQENHNESESTKRPSFNPLVGGGIAAVAAQAATKRNQSLQIVEAKRNEKEKEVLSTMTVRQAVMKNEWLR
jgi:hypothetical protein